MRPGGPALAIKGFRETRASPRLQAAASHDVRGLRQWIICLYAPKVVDAIVGARRHVSSLTGSPDEDTDYTVVSHGKRS
jgi:hypothetical protein